MCRQQMTNGADHPLSWSPETPAVYPGTDASSSDQGLPDFAKPPVIEVAASLQFDPIEGLDAMRFGLLWGAYRARYPRVETQPPLGDVKEVFGAISPPKFSFTLENAPPVLRYWFLNEPGTRMLQVQQSRFILNWRKMETEEPYPHYPEIRETLIEELAHFESFLEAESLARPSFNQAELTYVNHIPIGAPGGEEAVQRVVRLWCGLASGGPLPPAEEVSFQTRYVIPGDPNPRGRLYVTFNTRIRLADGAPVLVLQLTGRGAPTGPQLADALTLMDLEHRWIVQGFASMTTPEMHRTWERLR